jgi:hypothetical protein
MRDYAKVEPKMWHGQTMKALRRCPEGVIVGLYLMTSPQSNMLGLFSQPVLYMAHETGLGIEGATKGLQHCIDVGFCSFDEESEFVWVHEMARYQIANELKASDLRCKGIQKDYDALPDNPFLGEFFDRYAQAFHLAGRRGIKGASQAHTKPLRSQEQEQEQEKEQDIGSVCTELPTKTVTARMLVAEGVEKQTADDWLTLRKAKRLPLTPTAWNDTKAEGAKVGLTPPQTVAHAVRSNWAGFKASWYAKDAPGSSAAQSPLMAGVI